MPTKHHHLLRWLFAVAVAAVIVLPIMAWFAYPYFSYHEAFRRSKPALDAYARLVQQSGPSILASPPSQIGYFKVLKMEPLPQGFLF